MSAQSLPEGFEDLEPFVAKWAGADFAVRMDTRWGAGMDELLAFYQAVKPRLPEICERLETVEIENFTGEERRLYRVLMSLAHVAHAVERHKNPVPAGTTYPNGVRVLDMPAAV